MVRIFMFVLFVILLFHGAQGNLSEYLDSLENNMVKIGEHLEKVISNKLQVV